MKISKEEKIRRLKNSAIIAVVAAVVDCIFNGILNVRYYSGTELIRYILGGVLGLVSLFLVMLIYCKIAKLSVGRKKNLILIAILSMGAGAFFNVFAIYLPVIGIILAGIFFCLLFLFGRFIKTDDAKSLKQSEQSDGEKNTPSRKMKKSTKILLLVLAIVVIGGISAIVGVNHYLSRIYLKEGDYSAYTCHSCKNNASYVLVDGGYKQYYCSDHYEEAKALLEAKQNRPEKQSSTLSDDYRHTKFDATAIAKETVKEQLFYPLEAKFCSPNEATVTCDGNTWTVRGWVDAQNSFGVTSRSDYLVIFTFSSSEKYTVDLCSIK